MSRSLRSLLVTVLCLSILAGAVAWQNPAPTPPASGLLPVLKRAQPIYFKGNLHTHSFWSDGDDFPEMIADWYQQHGYHFLTLSDHNKLSEGQRWLDLKPAAQKALDKYLQRFGPDWVERRTAVKETEKKEQVRLKPLSEFRSLLEVPGQFLLIPGEEVTHKFAKNPVHINAINLRNPITPLDGTSVQETIAVNLRQIDEQRTKTGNRILAFLNHPNYGWGVKTEDMLGEDLKYFEVFNGHPGVKNYGDASHPNTERMWDILLALRLGKHKLPIVYALATDDAHAYHTFGVGKTNPGRGWIMVRAPYLSAEGIVRAMEEGDFYASTGVTLRSLRHDGKRFSVAIEPEQNVSYKTQFIATMRDAPLQSEPAKDKEGNVLPVTRIYSPEIGKVVQETEGLEPSYTFTGQELYVRAKILSTKPHPNPFQKGDLEVAWTQPMVP